MAAAGGGNIPIGPVGRAFDEIALPEDEVQERFAKVTLKHARTKVDTDFGLLKHAGINRV